MKHETAVYGHYMGGDPRRFTPDPECCTPEEQAAHKAACEAWDRGEQIEPEPESHMGGVCTRIERYGLGVTTYEAECEGATCVYCDGESEC